MVKFMLKHNKILICIILLNIVTLHYSFLFGKDKKELAMDNNPISKNEVILEVFIELRSPQHRPEIMKMIFNPDNNAALIEYGGRLVNPGRPQPGQNHEDKKPFYHYRPGKKQISLDEFKSISELLKNSGLWYVEKPLKVSDSGFQFLLSIKSRLKRDDSKNIKTILVKSSFFKDEKPTKEFEEIFSAIVNLYDGERGIFEPTKYD